MRGDIEFERLVDQHYGPLYRFAFSLCGNEHDAGDLVQETFHILIGRHEQILDPSKVKSWLFTTLYRLFLGRRRRVVRFPHHELEEVEEELPVTAPDSSFNVDWQSVTTALMRIDEVFRGPVALFYLEDNSYKEIAAILDVPLGTVKSRIARGLALLQKVMKDEKILGATAV